MKKFKFLPLLYYCLLGTIVPGMAQVPSTAPRIAATPVAKPGALKSLKTSSVRVWIPSMITTDPNAVFDTSRSTADVKLTTQYLDGLGRPFQTVARRISPKGNDMVTAVIYDSLGREQYKYLPYVHQKDSGHNGKIKSDPFAAQAAFYQDVNLNPGIADEHVYYSQTEYENSPLNRVLNTWAPGDSWAKTGGNHPIQMKYYYNDAIDAVRIWNIGISKKTCSGKIIYGSTSTLLPSSPGIYAAGQLTKNVIIDEAGHQSIEYKDKGGMVILRKTQLSDSIKVTHDGWICTYYVYDDMGSLRFVISPLAVQILASNNWSITETIADELCFQYQYDARGRMISKKIPGTGTVFMAYDSRNRLVFTQDSLQRKKSIPEWHTTFYDGLNRPYETAIYNSSSTRDELQCGITTNLDDTAAINLNLLSIPTDFVTTTYKSADNPYRATNSIIFDAGFTSPDGAEIDGYIVNAGGITNLVAANPIPNISNSFLTPLTYTYYDNYKFTGALNFTSDEMANLDPGSNPYSQPVTTNSVRVNGMQTGSQTRILGTENWLTSTSYYDEDGRVIQIVGNNSLGGKDIQSNLNDFTGTILSTYINHTNPNSKNTPQTTLLSSMNYDVSGHLTSVKKRVNGKDSLKETVNTSTYYELGLLQQKRLSASNTQTQLDSLTYTYNIRGWLTGINKNFVESANNSYNWFGQLFSYDYGFDNKLYNGNISGIIWKSKSNNIARAYGFTYDNNNRLIKAAFTQQNSAGSQWTSDSVDFTVSGITYDANSNILSSKQQGLIGTSISAIDDLSYKYSDNTNKLLSVTDKINTKTNKLGDFNDGENDKTVDDYSYDSNGNLLTDQNKAITSITYNYLNLPEKISIKTKGSISFQYTATGSKLKKTTIDSTVNPVKITTNDYDGIFLYQQDTLLSIAHDEGRIRLTYDSIKPVAYRWDYFEKDHLGNVRIVLNAQTDTSVYAATMEKSANGLENTLFSNINNTRDSIPPGYPTDATTNPNVFVSKLNAVSGQKIGPSIVLRVMAGDTIKIGVKAFYKSIGTNTSGTTTSNMLAALIQAFSGSTISDGTHTGAGNNSAISSSFTTNNYEYLKSKDPTENLPEKPKAYLNYVLFDDMFKLVDENSGVKQVQGNPDELQTLGLDRTVIKKTGFIYIYTSNESGENVYFDNLVVVHNSGPLLEETHYYPFGLTMAGISFSALKGAGYKENKLKYNGKELQNKEFADGSGLEMYDFKFRLYNQQIGRFFNHDKLAEKFVFMSPYQFCSNNPIWYREIDGLEGIKYTATINDQQTIFIEKNIVVMTEPKRQIPENASAKKIDNITNYNNNVDKQNNARVADIKEQLDLYYNGDDGKGTKDTKGNNVFFKFNYIQVPKENQEGKSDDEIDNAYFNIGRKNGVMGKRQDEFGKESSVLSFAAVITDEQSDTGGGEPGVAKGNVTIKMNNDARRYTLTHEVFHTLGGLDNNYQQGGLRNSPPEPITAEEVDILINQAYEKK